EYGITDRLQVALYANYAWTQAYHNGPFGATTPPEQFAEFQPGADDHFNQSRFIGFSRYRPTCRSKSAISENAQRAGAGLPIQARPPLIDPQRQLQRFANSFTQNTW